MSDIKFCPSCGTSLSVNAVFCHNCGQKQNVTTEPEPIPEAKATEPEAVEQTAPPAEEQPAESKIPPQANNVQPEVKLQDTYVTPETLTKPAPIQVEQPSASQVAQPSAPQADPQPVNPPQPQSAYQKPASAYPQPTQQPYQPGQQPYQPVQQPYQQPYYPQNPMPQQARPTPAKKFPWFFTLLWLVLLAGVGVWGYFLFLYENYPKPLFTEDAQRIVIFVASAFVLLYTLSLKLSVKKLKILPTIILILCALVGFYLFSMIELVDGDWLHDAISDITENILPVSGD